MSWFKRSGSTAVETYPQQNVATLPVGSSANHNRAAADSALLLHAAHSLWNTVETVLNKHEMGPSENEIAAVVSFVTEVATSLECHNTLAHTQLTDFILMVDAMDKLLMWSTRFSAVISKDIADRLALLQLRVFDLLLSQSERCLLTEKRLIRPLLRLLVACGTSNNSAVEDQLALVLHQLCIGVSQYPAALELLFDGAVTGVNENEVATGTSNATQFLVFSLLIPYVHREGLIAQQARDDLLLIMSMSSSHDVIGKYIVDRSDFCPVIYHLVI
jgi:Retinoic acid induced 16-like protein